MDVADHEDSWKKTKLQGLPRLSNEKKTGCLRYIGDEKLPSYVGIIINHEKDPY